jgi:glycosyltransferase involved in cell wall biosynthesis
MQDPGRKANQSTYEPCLVSVIISNYNYKRFLREAIDSALNQTYPNIEVIVVDDGSTDNSRAIVKSYGKRITPVLKENGGQATAVNAGFGLSKGKIVIFLDADDVLLPHIVQQVVAAFQAEPNTVKVQYRMRVINARGNPTGELRPPAHMSGPSGDLRQHIIKHHWYYWPPTSGNAFASATLQQLFPIPVDIYLSNPDVYLCNLSAVFGPIVSLDEVGALYRVHGNNNYSSSAGAINLAALRTELSAIADSHAKQKHLLNALYSANVREIGSYDLYFLSGRAASLKIDPDNHPFEDSLLRLCARGCTLAMTEPNAVIRNHARLLWSSWFIAMLFAPKTLAKTLTEKFYFRDRRGKLYDTLISLLYGRR